MSERSPDRPPVPPDQLTRDITLPPLPGRPPPSVPPEWASYVPPPGTPGAPDAADGAVTMAAPEFDGPTEQVSGRSTPHRDPTMPIVAPEGLASASRDAGTPSPPRPRWTSRVLWTLVFLTVAVLVACGVFLIVTVARR
jgi:hypothetical protein